VHPPSQIDFKNFGFAVADLLDPVPLSDWDDSFATYASVSNRSKRFVEHVRLLQQDAGVVGGNDFVCDSFIKDEHYGDDIKFARLINALPDKYKGIFGPLFRVLEKHYFTRTNVSHFYVKKIPVVSRPLHVSKLFGSEPVMVGDFSSFEVTSQGVFARVIFRVYSRLLQFHPQRANILKILWSLLLEFNIVRFKGLGVKGVVSQTLMSGAVWTSLQNGILSMLIISYLRLKAAHPHLPGRRLANFHHEVVGLFEGDDSITLGGRYDSSIIAALGVNLKSVPYDTFEEASFCGILGVVGTDATITDPKKVLAGFFQLPAKYFGMKDTKLSCLVRAKALSYGCLYYGCPVIGHLVHAVLKRTRGFAPDTRSLSYHQLEMYEAVSDLSPFRKLPEIDSRTRSLFQVKYGWSFIEQENFEKDITSWGNGVQLSVRLPRIFDDLQSYGLRQVSQLSTREMPLWEGPLVDPDSLVGLGVLTTSSVCAGDPMKPGKRATYRSIPVFPRFVNFADDLTLNHRVSP